MRHLLGILAATTTLLFAAACGSDSGTTVDDPSSPSGSTLVEILSQTAAGGQTDDLAVDLGTPAGVDELLADVSRGPLAAEVRDRVAATDVPEGQRLVGAIVNEGCDTPVDVKVTAAGDGVRLEPIFQGKPMVECVAAVTSIALVLVAA